MGNLKPKAWSPKEMSQVFHFDEICMEIWLKFPPHSTSEKKLNCILLRQNGHTIFLKNNTFKVQESNYTLHYDLGFTKHFHIQYLVYFQKEC